MSATSREERAWKSPLRKLTRFFEGSRDRWKAKHGQLKRERKGMENQIRAVEKSREQWSARAQEAEQRVIKLERELEDLKKTRC